MIKRLLLPMIALGVMAVSCDVNDKDSYQTIRYGDYNLVVDLDNPDQPAQATSGSYEVKYVFNKLTADVKTSDLIINNQKASFETDTMRYGGNETQILFSKLGIADKSGTVKDLSATVDNGYKFYSVNTDGSEPKFYYDQRLVMRYTYNDRYSVRTFCSESSYFGESTVYDDVESCNTKESPYRINIDFSKNLATIVVYSPKFSENQKDVINVIQIEEVPVKFTHDSYFLAADAPKTKVLKVESGKAELVESDDYKVTNLSVRYNTNLTEATVTYNIAGKSVYFQGSSVYKKSSSSN